MLVNLPNIPVYVKVIMEPSNMILKCANSHFTVVGIYWKSPVDMACLITPLSV